MGDPMDSTEIAEQVPQPLPPEGEEPASQTFDPAPRHEKPRRHGARPRTKLRSLENLSDFAKNRYEGVLIAAARARQLNAKKVAYEERGLEEAAELKRYKMTSYALRELLDGKIEVTRPEEEFPA
jgi:DNA-directed RNA polymerase omega subunit